MKRWEKYREQVFGKDSKKTVFEVFMHIHWMCMANEFGMCSRCPLCGCDSCLNKTPAIEYLEEEIK